MGKKKPPITREQLSAYYHLPMAEVAHELGMCPTLLKRICRRVGIARWPYRKLRSIDRTVAALEHTLSQRRRQSVAATESPQPGDSTTATTEDLEHELVLLLHRRQCLVEDAASTPTTVVPSSPPHPSSCTATTTTTTTTTTTSSSSKETECEDGDDGVLPRRWRMLVQCPDTGAVRAVFLLPPLTLPPVAQ